MRINEKITESGVQCAVVNYKESTNYDAQWTSATLAIEPRNQFYMVCQPPGWLLASFARCVKLELDTPNAGMPTSRLAFNELQSLCQVELPTPTDKIYDFQHLKRRIR